MFNVHSSIISAVEYSLTEQKLSILWQIMIFKDLIKLIILQKKKPVKRHLV